MPTPTLHDPELCQALLRRLEDLLDRPMRFMEVCGTHTVSIFRGGLRTLLPEQVTHLTGPGCPVCVTHDREVAAFLKLAEQPNVIIATFGDLMRVPGPDGRSLKHAQADGARVSVIYSPLDALTLAADNPDATVVFLGVGFETTAPAVAATVLAAEQRKLDNFTVFSCHKLVPPALAALLGDPDNGIDAFLLPGHVSTVLGLSPFRFVAEDWKRPAIVAGFEPADILAGLLSLIRQINEGQPRVDNCYPRVVTEAGNRRAQGLIETVFEPADSEWRGLGTIAGSGLVLREQYRRFDGMARLGIEMVPTREPKGCRCGEILQGRLLPPDCPLYGTACTPLRPVGPCMVSGEGTCAAYHRFSDRKTSRAAESARQHSP